ncbi:MAG: electron transfer flavoprotein subunit alpha/FixB family protein, partial [Leifsonia sp.]
MSKILVLIEHADSKPAANAGELLAAAALLGEPHAVVVASADAAPLASALGALGAANVHVATVADGDTLVTPAVAALAAAASAGDVGAVLVGTSLESREAAARLAIRIGGAYLSDAVGIGAGAGSSITVTQQAFGGAYTVTAA